MEICACLRLLARLHYIMGDYAEVGLAPSGPCPQGPGPGLAREVGEDTQGMDGALGFWALELGPPCFAAPLGGAELTDTLG